MADDATMRGVTERPAPRSAGVFVGREQELDELSTAMDDAAAGQGSVFLIAGEPGIGKSRLADEIAVRARDRGFAVTWGRCWEAGGAPAYWPWVQALRAYVRTIDGAELAQDLGDGAGHVAQVLPDLLSVLPHARPPEVGDPDTARFLLFDAATSFLVNASRRRPILLVLDDLHVADAPSLLLLRFAANEIRRSCVIVVGAYRDPDPDRDGPLPKELVELASEPATRFLPLAGLSEPDVTRFIDRTTTTVPPASLVSAVYQETEGNPLFVGEVVRLLAQEGRLGSMPAGTRLAIPASLREVIGRRLEHLSEGCRDTLAICSVIGREFDLELVARVVGPEREIRGHFDEAARLRVLGEVPGVVGRFRFGHALIRDTLYDAIPSSARVDLHRRTGEALESLPRNEQAGRLAELAHHFHLAAPDGRSERGIAYARRAGDEAMTRLAYEEAVRLYEMALQGMRFHDASSDVSRCELLLQVGDARSKAGELASAREAFAQAAELAKRLGRSDDLAAAAIGYGGWFVWVRAQGDQRFIRMLEDALRATGEAPSTWKVRLLGRLACALRDSPEHERSDALSAEAVEIARELGDPETLLYALEGRYGAIWWPDNPDERLEIADEIVAGAGAAEDREREFQAHHCRLISFLELGDISMVEAELAHLARPADELRTPAQRWMVAAISGNLAFERGRLADAERFAIEAREAGARSMLTDAEAHFASHLYLIRTEQGRPRDALEPIRQAVDRFGWYPFFRCQLADLHLQLEDEHQAKALYESLASDDFHSLPRDNEWIFTLTSLAPLSVRFGDDRGMERLYEMLLPFAERHAVGHAEGATGSVSRALGVLAAGLSRFGEAERHFTFAIDHNERMGARLWTVDTQVRFAEMLFTRDAMGDRDRANGILADAMRTAESLGLVRLERAVRALRAEAETGKATADTAPATAATFRREGEYWSILFDGHAMRARDSKGMRYLARLLASPGREIHALELATTDDGSSAQASATENLALDAGDAGPVLDAQAKGAYRDRLRELEAELREAEEWNDTERAARLRDEMDFLTRELGAAVGLGGRDRRAASNAERARVNVTRSIKSAVDRIAEHHPALGRHLATTIRTGVFCAYQPDPRVPISWSS